jgi:hypothetical protein
MSTNILDGYIREPIFAADNDICRRTCARYRGMGLPFLIWGGEVYVHVEGAREWLLGRTRRRNQPRAKASRAA